MQWDLNAIKTGPELHNLNFRGDINDITLHIHKLAIGKHLNCSIINCILFFAGCVSYAVPFCCCNPLFASHQKKKKVVVVVGKGGGELSLPLKATWPMRIWNNTGD